MKQIIKFLSAVAIVSFTVALSACNKNGAGFSDNEGVSQGLEFTLNDDKISYSLTGIGTCKDTNIVIPATYNKRPVTTIAESVFAVENTSEIQLLSNTVQSAKLKHVENTRKSGASPYEHIYRVEIPQGVISIENFAFADCINLKSVVIPDTLINCGKDIFQNCTLLKYTRYEGISYLGNNSNPYLWAYMADDQPSVELHKDALLVNGEAFAQCYSLTNIAVAEGNVNYKSENGVLYNKSGSIIIRYPGFGSNTDFTIPDTVTTIGSSAFDHCQNLINVVIPDSVTSIKEHAFFKCSDLRSIVIGNSVTTIEDGAFDTCDNLRSIVMGNSITTIGNQAFFNCSSLLNIEIPDSVITLGENVFYDCSKLIEVYNKSNLVIKKGDYGLNNVWNVYTPNEGASKLSTDENGFVIYTDGTDKLLLDYIGIQADIKIPAGITEIYNRAFAYRNNLTSVEIPNSVKIIGKNAFFDCIGLTGLKIPDNVTIVEDGAFLNCKNLRSVEIGNSVTSIGNRAFADCYKLIEIYNKSNLVIGKEDYGLKYILNIYTPNNGTSKLSETEKGFIIYTDGANKLLIDYIDTQTDIEIPAGITELYEGVFAYRNDLTSVEIPDSVTTIGNSAFYNCESLTSVEIPDNVTTIGNSAFYNCESLTSLEIPDSVTTIEEGAFNGCYGLTSVVIGNSVTTMESAFGGCANLTSVYYTGNIADWCSIFGLFSLMANEVELYIDNAKIEGELIIPDNVTIIEDSAFYKCNDLTSVYIPDSVVTINGRAFFQCESLTSVTFEMLEGWFVNGILFSSADLENPETAARYLTDTYREAYWSLGEEYRKDLHYTLSNDYTYYIVSNIGAYEGTDVVISDTYKNLPVKKIGEGAFQNCDNLRSVIIPSSITSIGESAFEGCVRLASVVIPNSVTSIGNRAFNNCGSLTSIEISESVTNLGNDVFLHCYSLMNMAVNENNGNYKDIDGNLYTKDGKILLQYAIGKTESCFTIPETVTSIIDSAFWYCKNLTSVVIGENVTSIGNFAFENCTSLISVEISDSVTSIGNSAFNNCESLKSVTFKNPNDWNINGESLSMVDLENSETAARYLRETYCSYAWTREKN